MTKHVRVLNPKSNNDIFGAFPQIDKNGIYLPAGSIHLLNGEHLGPNRGFGVAHIIAEHDGQISRAYPSLAGLAPHDKVANYVVMMLLRKAPIYVEAGNQKRPVVVHSAVGSVILERRGQASDAWYSIVSAFGRKNSRGQLIANLL
jgi:hypothetical protein